ncbi:hypothetical protein [uncultured Nostoc sp.]|uniref:exodeoxyribonuclease X C-terminal domain-containing protein n=1 Tax=uncultured Nostoc sp. TaxID=340711 RepID=UPI0035C9B05E
MKTFVSSQAKCIRRMSDEAQMLRMKNNCESILNQEESNYTASEYVEFLISGKYKLFDILQDYIEITARIANVDLSEDNILFNKINSIRKNSLKKRFNNEVITEEESNFEKLMCYRHQAKVHWGIYAENSIKDILINDPEYILWCIINLDHFFIGNYVFAINVIRKSEYYLPAIEMNSIKRLIETEWKQEEGDCNIWGNFDAFEGDHLSWFNYNQ